MNYIPNSSGYNIQFMTVEEHEAAHRGAKNMNKEFFRFEQAENFSKIESGKKIIVSIDKSNRKDKIACLVMALDAARKATVLAARTFSKTVSAVQAYAQTLLSVYQNKHVLHLAKYHPKERVRKKNFHRIMQELERR